jgi:LuxR family maltose regulon positive regulatory protein
MEPLTIREREVVRLLAAGLSNRAIAEELVVSANTVKTQVRSIYGKLGVHDREQLLATARRLHLL